MRFYGTIETNLISLLEKSNNGKSIEDLGYSIDTLMFETPDGETFNIDFEEADYAFEEESLTFRLKSLGMTFADEWKTLHRTDNVDFERDYDFFSICELKSIVLYLPEEIDISSFENELYFKVLECDLFIGEDSISYDFEYIEVEY